MQPTNNNTASLNPAGTADHPLQFWHQTPALEERLPISAEITPASGIATIKPIYDTQVGYATTPPCPHLKPVAYAFITHATARNLDLTQGALDEHFEKALAHLNTNGDAGSTALQHPSRDAPIKPERNHSMNQAHQHDVTANAVTNHHPEPNHTLVIEVDDDPQDPREYLPTRIWHPRTRSTNINTTDSECPFDENGNLREGIAIAEPLYMLDHSGRALSLTPFNDPWDSGQLGFVYLMTDQLEGLGLTADDEEGMTKILQGDIDVMEAWMEGSVYRFSILDSDGEEVESVGELYDLGDFEESLLKEISYHTDRFPKDEAIARKFITTAFSHLGASIPFHIPVESDENPLWGNDLIQFARLLNEIELNVNLTDEQFAVLQDAMDLTREEIEQLFERAQGVFDASKAKA